MLDDHQACLPDLTDALNYNEYLCGVGHASGRGLQVKLFCLRAHAYEIMREPEKSLKDLEASLAAIRSDADQGGWSAAVQEQMMRVVTREKLNTPRPQFTTEEQQMLEAKLAVGRRANDFFFCYHCGKDEQPGVVDLRLCSRCHQCWFCSRECQLASCSDHKQECSTTLKLPHLLPDNQGHIVEESWDHDGLAQVMSFREMPQYLAKDPNTGRYFEPLADCDVFFKDEAHLIPPKNMQFQRKIVVKIRARYGWHLPY